MQRFTSTLILSVFLVFSFYSPAASFWGSDNLVTIDGTSYTIQDFETWWENWNDSGLALPKTPDPYIDWLLLAREGKRMKLDEDPAFQHKTGVFLKFRSLMLLQKEEVFDKLKAGDKEVRAEYKAHYTPMWLLDRLQFADKDKAQAAFQGLNDGTLKIDELIKLPEEKGGPIEHGENWRRPYGIDDFWAAIFKKLEVGKASEPIQDLDYYYVYYLKEKNDGDAEDLSKLRPQIEEEIKEKQKNALTEGLLLKLREKYGVKVDEKRLADLDLEAPEDSFGDTPIIFTDRRNFTEKEFVQIARKDQQARQSHQSASEMEAIKRRVVGGIISQNLVDWEALARHYEEKEPLKSLYEFNINHRLTTMLERRLFVPNASVTEKEIEEEYNKNLSRYSLQENVKIGLIEDVDGIAERIWTEVATGIDFFKAVREITKKDAIIKTIPVAHLDPAVKDVVDGLAKGETSRLFTNQGHRFIIYLEDRVPERPIPLKKVAESIRSKLRKEKLEQQRKAYLDLLKSRSEIKVNDANWKIVQKELGEVK